VAWRILGQSSELTSKDFARGAQYGQLIKAAGGERLLQMLMKTLLYATLAGYSR